MLKWNSSVSVQEWRLSQPNAPATGQCFVSQQSGKGTREHSKSQKAGTLTPQSPDGKGLNFYRAHVPILPAALDCTPKPYCKAIRSTHEEAEHSPVYGAEPLRGCLSSCCFGFSLQSTVHEDYEKSAATKWSGSQRLRKHSECLFKTGYASNSNIRLTGENLSALIRNPKRIPTSCGYKENSYLAPYLQCQGP